MEGVYFVTKTQMEIKKKFNKTLIIVLEFLDIPAEAISFRLYWSLHIYVIYILVDVNICSVKIQYYFYISMVISNKHFYRKLNLIIKIHI